MDEQCFGPTRELDPQSQVNKVRFPHSGWGMAVSGAPDGVTTKGLPWRIAAVNIANLQAGPPHISLQVSTAQGGVTAG